MKTGENPYFIAKKLGVGMLDLLKWNDMGKKQSFNLEISLYITARNQTAPRSSPR